jgi:hypothetical protein
LRPGGTKHRLAGTVVFRLDTDLLGRLVDSYLEGRGAVADAIACELRSDHDERVGELAWDTAYIVGDELPCGEHRRADGGEAGGLFHG